MSFQGPVMGSQYNFIDVDLNHDLQCRYVPCRSSAHVRCTTCKILHVGCNTTAEYILQIPESEVNASAPSANAAVQKLLVGEGGQGQRLDNWLVKTLKGVPKSHLYQMIRSGQVRVDGARAQADTRLAAESIVRVPPVRLPATQTRTVPGVEFPVLHEDEYLLIINKPAGVAVHGGSGVSSGVIEQLRMARQAPYLELAHRIDRETSGVLVLAKKRSALAALQKQLREGGWKKEYLLAVLGDAPFEHKEVRLALSKTTTSEGARKVYTDATDGQFALTRFAVRERLGAQMATLMSARILTGRTHQIRVHATAIGLPLVGDERYGDFARNKALRVKRMLLHAHRLALPHPANGELLSATAPLPDDFLRELERLRTAR